MTETTLMLDSILKALDDIQAIDVTVLNVTNQTTITDYMIVASGRSSRHVKSIAEHVMEHMKKRNAAPLSSTGLDEGGWALVDFGDCILHIMQAETRSFYNLEALWQEVPR